MKKSRKTAAIEPSALQGEKVPIPLEVLLKNNKPTEWIVVIPNDKALKLVANRNLCHSLITIFISRLGHIIKIHVWVGLMVRVVEYC